MREGLTVAALLRTRDALLYPEPQIDSILVCHPDDRAAVLAVLGTGDPDGRYCVVPKFSDFAIRGKIVKIKLPEWSVRLL